MTNAAISDIKLLEVTDGNAVHSGCDQEWYGSWWRRTAGCGPSTFSNIMYYIRRRSGVYAGTVLREEFAALMDDVWESVTPGVHGLSSTAMFADGARDFSERFGLGLTVCELPILKGGEKPPLDDVVRFITDILEHDAPVAFLALDNGEEKRLDSWHWVTLWSIEHGASGTVNMRLLDNGKPLEADLGLWLATTKRGGGFAGVYCV